MRSHRSWPRSRGADVAGTPRVALCGAGMISQAHAAAATASGMQVVAVASRSHARAASRAAELGAVAVAYDDLPGDADIVVVSTPPARHADDAIHALRAGAAVVVEKPLCTTLADADRVVEAAAAHAERLLYAENLAYAPVVQALVARVGDLGPLTHLEVRSLQGLPTWGDFTTEEWGGGALFDLGVHPLAVALLCANAGGAGSPVSVAARLEGGVGHGTDEWAEVRLTYAGGLVARVESSWRSPDSTVWDAQVASAIGVLRAELLPPPSLERDGDEVVLPPVRAAVPAVERFGYLGQLRAFADDVGQRRTPLMSAGFGRFVLDVVCAAYRSAGRGSEPEPLPFQGPRDLTPLQLWRGEQPRPIRSP